MEVGEEPNPEEFPKQEKRDIKPKIQSENETAHIVVKSKEYLSKKGLDRKQQKALNEEKSKNINQSIRERGGKKKSKGGGKTASGKLTGKKRKADSLKKSGKSKKGKR